MHRFRIAHGKSIPWPLAAGAALLVFLAAVTINNWTSTGSEPVGCDQGECGSDETSPSRQSTLENDRPLVVYSEETLRSRDPAPEIISHATTRTFDGVVKDPSGLPVDDVDVRHRTSGAFVATTDARGEFSYTPPAGSPSVLLLTKPDYRETSVRLAAPPRGESLEPWRREITIVPLGPLYPVNGYVELPRRFVPGAASARLESPGNRARYTAPVGDNGHYRFPEVEQGDDYRLRVGATRYFKSVERGPLEIFGPTTLPDVRLEALRYADLTVHVIDANGLPIANKDIVVEIESERSSSANVTTDSGGMFTLERLPEGQLTVRTRGYPKLAVSDIRFDAWQDTSLVLTMKLGDRALRGTVIDESGTPVAGAVVEVSASATVNETTSQATFRAHTNRAGEFRFSRLAPGGLELRVSSPRFEPLTVEASADDAPMTLVLDEG